MEIFAPQSSYRSYQILKILRATCFHPGFLFGIFFDSEAEGDMFLRNIG
jgi:hypothetical protein